MVLEDVQNIIIEILDDIVREWNIGGVVQITATTLLSGDLGLSSLNSLQLMATLDMRLGRALPYEQLVIPEHGYVRDLSVAQLAEFAFSRVA